MAYADRMSAAPGQVIRFMVSSTFPAVEAEIVRLTGRSGRFERVEAPVNGGHECRVQPIYPGSYGVVNDDPILRLGGSFTAVVWVCSSTPNLGRDQGLLTKRSKSGVGLGLFVSPAGDLSLRAANDEASWEIRSHVPLLPWRWYLVAGCFDVATGRGTVYQIPAHSRWEEPVTVLGEEVWAAPGISNCPVLIGAGSLTGILGRSEGAATDLFNGKLENPRLYDRALTQNELMSLAKDSDVGGALANWDFSRDISGTSIADIAKQSLDGRVINSPARAVTGHAWRPGNSDYSVVPEEWAAIHFHEDDLEDAGWEPSFEWLVPETLRSGIYALRLSSAHRDLEWVPFFVRPRRSSGGLAVLAPTFTYMAYANHHQATEAAGVGPYYSLFTDRSVQLGPIDELLQGHPELGLSLYDLHGDGSPNLYSSRLRPIASMRPDYNYWITGAPRNFAADLFLIEWLEEKGYAYDVITDEDLHSEGSSLLSGYSVLLTGSHPEYWTGAMLDSLEQYQESGGRLMYLGGNGFWWVTSVDPSRPHLIEVRKGYPFRDVMAGEAHHSSSGERGGLWRDRGRAPQRIAGVGTIAMGWGPAPGYVRQPDSFNPRAAFVFEGIAQNEVIGDFGYILGGAAGDEIDRLDFTLGAPPHTLLLASSSGHHSDHYYAMPSEISALGLGMGCPGHGGSQDPGVRADMTLFETSNGGAVFSVGSMNWLGSLTFDHCRNNVSTITENVLRHFLESRSGLGDPGSAVSADQQEPRHA